MADAIAAGANAIAFTPLRLNTIAVPPQSANPQPTTTGTSVGTRAVLHSMWRRVPRDVTIDAAIGNWLEILEQIL